MDYRTFKRNYQNAVNNASWGRFLFWAFSNEQFDEGVKKTNAKKNKRGKWMMHQIEGGGYLTQAGYATWIAFWNNWHRYEEKVKMNEKEIIDGLIYEYRNHEAQFGMGGRENAEALFPKATEHQKELAWKKFMRICHKEDLF